MRPRTFPNMKSCSLRDPGTTIAPVFSCLSLFSFSLRDTIADAGVEDEDEIIDDDDDVDDKSKRRGGFMALANGSELALTIDEAECVYLS